MLRERKQLKGTAKGGQKKQSISREEQQHEKERIGAKLTGECIEMPVSQSLDEKAAINPAKRVEVNGELHSDNVAEWDAEKFSKHEETLRALEQRIDLAPLVL